jgi:hypothetical protein
MLPTWTKENSDFKQKNVKLRNSNQMAQQRRSSIKAVLKHPEEGPNSSASSTDISSMLAPPARPSGEKLARIDSISPRSVMVGQEFYITGDKFGRPSQGKVYLSVGRITYECSIRGWMENEIRAIVPHQTMRSWGDRSLSLKGRISWIPEARLNSNSGQGHSPDRLKNGLTDRLP